jgi:hypothetical protein
MRRALTATLAALCAVGFINMPVLADDTASNTDSATTSDASSDSSSEDKDGKKIAQKDPKAGKDPAKAKSSKSGDVILPVRLASFTVCSFVGLPIAVTRRCVIEMKQGNHDLIGDPDVWYRKVGMVFPGFLCIPYGAVSGGASGTYYDLKNAWVGSGHDPFGKEAISLEDIGN